MNDLNSTLIEGIVQEDMKRIDENEPLSCWTFEIESIQHFGSMTKIIEEKGIFHIVARLGKDYRPIVKGEKLRVVGRLRTDLGGHAFVASEHIERKP